MNPDWQRWIFASVSKWFADQFADLAIPDPVHFWVEGMPYDTEGLSEWVEFRMDGPKWQGGTAIEWTADDININCLVMLKQNRSDNHRLQRLIGAIVPMFTATIPVLKLGDGPGDDGSHVTCLQLRTDRKEKVVVHQLGAVDPTTQLLRATIDAHYFGDF